jgi:hypothetical protein
MTGTVVKKGLLQSSPWIGAALLVLLGAWVVKADKKTPDRREILALSLIVVPVFAMIAYAGYGKTDGISHNQRYLLETVPLLAIALGIAIARLKVNGVQALLGFVVGVVMAFVVILVVQAPLKYGLLVNLPLLIGLTLMIALVLARFQKVEVTFSLILGLAIGWSFFVHLNDDVRGVSARRGANLERTEILDSVVPDGSALVAYWGSKDAAGPLQMEKDLVILDAWADGGQDAPVLVNELLASGRRVFVLADMVPQSVMMRMTEGHQQLTVHTNGMTIVEIRLLEAGDQ